MREKEEQKKEGKKETESKRTLHPKGLKRRMRREKKDETVRCTFGLKRRQTKEGKEKENKRKKKEERKERGRKE